MRKILVDIPQLNAGHKADIEAAAKRHGFMAAFTGGVKPKAMAEAADAEIIFSPEPALLPVARELKWICVSYAGVEPFVSMTVTMAFGSWFSAR